MRCCRRCHTWGLAAGLEPHTRLPQSQQQERQIPGQMEEGSPWAQGLRCLGPAVALSTRCTEESERRRQGTGPARLPFPLALGAAGREQGRAEEEEAEEEAEDAEEEEGGEREVAEPE